MWWVSSFLLDYKPKLSTDVALEHSRQVIAINCAMRIPKCRKIHILTYPKTANRKGYHAWPKMSTTIFKIF